MDFIYITLFAFLACYRVGSSSPDSAAIAYRNALRPVSRTAGSASSNFDSSSRYTSPRIPWSFCRNWAFHVGIVASRIFSAARFFSIAVRASVSIDKLGSMLPVRVTRSRTSAPNPVSWRRARRADSTSACSAMPSSCRVRCS